MTSSKGGYPIDKEDILKRAAGHWERIISDLVPQLAHAVEAGPKKKVGCPFHPGKTDANLRVMPGFPDTGAVVCNTCGVKVNGLATLAWAGRSYWEALRDVSDWLGGYTRSMTPEALARVQQDLEAKRRKKQREQAWKDKFFQRELNRVWRDSVPLNHPLAEPGRLYLSNRGIAKPTSSSDVRVHPNLEYCNDEGEVLATLPTIVLRYRTADGKPGTLHRIYTSHDGQKLTDLVDRKKMMAHPSTKVLTGGAIRLTAIAEVLGVAEGYETAEAVMELFPRTPCWPLYSATLMESFKPPRGVRKVIIFADKDSNRRGEEAAKILIKRLWELGIQAEVKFPPIPIPEGETTVDWLDFLNYRKAKLAARKRSA